MKIIEGFDKAGKLLDRQTPKIGNINKKLRLGRLLTMSGGTATKLSSN